jgi:hypothetical protein
VPGVPDGQPVIPPNLWAHLIAFIAEGRTGSVRFHVHRGQVHAADVAERIGATTRDAPALTARLAGSDERKVGR